MIQTPWSAAKAALALLVGAAPTQARDSSEPLLRLEDAASIARGNNHSLAASALELDKTEERSAATRTRRYPAFKLDAVGVRLLNSPEFTYPAGSFGTYAGVGQVPATDTTVFVRDLRIVRWDAEEQPKAPPPREDPHPVLPSAA